MYNMKPPSTYSEWVSLLDNLREKTDDEVVLDCMKKGTIVWQSGVAERFAQKLIDTVNYRMNVASDKFQKEMNRAKGQESSIVRALLALRREMKYLSEVVNIDAIPAKNREQYRQLVIQQANSMQRSLEDSAKRDRSGKLSSIVRNNRVNNF